MKTRCRFRKPVSLAVVCLLLLGLTGCEAFVRKFTRKPRKEKLPQEEKILVPEEYKVAAVPKSDLYRQYFLFWRSWQDELVESLSLSNTNQKKRLSCAREAIKNLLQLKGLLKEDAQNKLDRYIAGMQELNTMIQRDVYGTNVSAHRSEAERLRRNIIRDFSYNKAKDSLA